MPEHEPAFTPPIVLALGVCRFRVTPPESPPPPRPVPAVTPVMSPVFSWSAAQVMPPSVPMPVTFWVPEHEPAFTPPIVLADGV